MWKSVSPVSLADKKFVRTDTKKQNFLYWITNHLQVRTDKNVQMTDTRKKSLEHTFLLGTIVISPLQFSRWFELSSVFSLVILYSRACFYTRTCLLTILRTADKNSWRFKPITKRDGRP